MKHKERFAPSPTGPLHLGHAFSAITAWNNAKKANGVFLLRIEDIDRSRALPDWEQLILEDLSWLGLSWKTPVMRQSNRLPVYQDALSKLWDRGLLYPCSCNRRDVLEAASAPQEGSPMTGPDGIIYPGTCRRLGDGAFPNDCVLRLNMFEAVKQLEASPLIFTETGDGSEIVSILSEELIETVGDVVLARKDMGTSYHLSVVLDDAEQEITHVTRGEDLRDATPLHVLLQRLFGLTTPIYHHHHLIRDESGKRLAKRDDARAISTFRNDGATPQDIYEMIDLKPLALR